MKSLACAVLIAALATALSGASCAKVLDGYTNDGTALETAAAQGDAASGTGSSSASPPSCNPCIIFVNNLLQLGGVGIAGADNLCNADSAKPAGTYKALLASAARQPPSTDWPLAASWSYVRSDGNTPIGTTTSGAVFTFPLTNAVSTGGSTAWTGLTTTWTVSPNNCSGWTTNNGAFNGVTGAIGFATSGAFSIGTNNCSVSNFIYCVQQ